MAQNGAKIRVVWDDAVECMTGSATVSFDTVRTVRPTWVWENSVKAGRGVCLGIVRKDDAGSLPCRATGPPSRAYLSAIPDGPHMTNDRLCRWS